MKRLLILTLLLIAAAQAHWITGLWSNASSDGVDQQARDSATHALEVARESTAAAFDSVLYAVNSETTAFVTGLPIAGTFIEMHDDSAGHERISVDTSQTFPHAAYATSAGQISMTGDSFPVTHDADTVGWTYFNTAGDTVWTHWLIPHIGLDTGHYWVDSALYAANGGGSNNPDSLGGHVSTEYVLNDTIAAIQSYYSPMVTDSCVANKDTISLAAGLFHRIVLDTGANDIEFTGGVAGMRTLFKVVQGGGAVNGTVTWPTMTWMGGVAPVLDTTNGAADWIAVVYDGGYVGSSGYDPWASRQTLAMGDTSVDWNLSLGAIATVTLTANDTIQNPTNLVNGKTATLVIMQDGTGSRVPVWGANFRWSGDAVPTLTATASAGDMLEFVCWQDSLMVFKNFSPAILP